MRELTPDHVLRATLSLLGTEGRTRNRKPHGSGHGTSVKGSADRARSHGVVEGGSVQRQSHLPGQEAEITSWRHG